MGSVVSNAMDDNLKKNQEFMLKMQKATVERQLNMQNLMREKGMAMQLAAKRDMFLWFQAFFGLTVLGSLGAFMRTRNHRVIAPLIPLSFIYGYQADLVYGNKMERMRLDAENILAIHKDSVELPLGMITVDDIDKAVAKSKDTLAR